MSMLMIQAGNDGGTIHGTRRRLCGSNNNTEGAPVYNFGEGILTRGSKRRRLSGVALDRTWRQSSVDIKWEPHV